MPPSPTADSSAPCSTAPPRTPAPVYARYTCSDVDEAAARLREWDQTYEQLAAGRFEGVTTDLWLGPLQVFRERSNRVMHESGRAWSGSVCFGMPLRMNGTARFFGRDMGPEDVLVLGPDSELDFVTPPELDIVGISVQVDWLVRHADRLPDGGALGETGARRIIRLPTTAAHGLRGFLGSLFEAVEERPAQLNSPSLRRSVADHVLANLLETMEGSADSQPPLPRYPAQRRLVERARDYVLARADAPVTIAELCRELRVSRRTLQYAFEHTLAVSPVQYLRTIRLHAVRRALRSTRRDELTIHDAAAHWGFWHLSRFAADYRRQFGQAPSDTPRAGR